MPDLDDHRLDNSISALKYVGPYLASRFRTHSFWPPDGPNSRHHPIYTLRELLRFVQSRRGQNARYNLTNWLNLITTNAQAEQCVPAEHLETCRHYRVRGQNLWGRTMVINFLREYLPENHIHKVPVRQAHTSSGPFQRECCPDGPRRPKKRTPPRTLLWDA